MLLAFLAAMSLSAPLELRCDDAGDLHELMRIDRASPSTRLRPMRKTPEGFLIAEGFAARPGVLRYRNPDGSVRRELVTLETLKQSFEPLKGKPVTLRHPHGKKVTPENARRTIVGTVNETRIDDASGMLVVEVTIYTDDAIKAVEAGSIELSPGYGVRLDSTQGVDPDFGEYDARQVFRVYNHLAICDIAHGGPGARGWSGLRLRTDAAIEINDDGDHMHPLLLALLLGLGINNDEIDPDKPEGAFKKANDKLGKLKKDHDTFKGRADAAKDPTADEIEKGHLEYFDTRKGLVELATHFNVDTFETVDGEKVSIGNGALAKKVALTAYPEADKEGSADYYAALLTTAKSSMTTRADSKKNDPYAQFGTGFDKKPRNRTDDSDRVDADNDFVFPSHAYLEGLNKARKPSQ
jgi:hypothetical protein